MASPGAVVIQFLVDAKSAARDAAGLAKSFTKVDREADGLDSTLNGLESELDSIGRETAALKADMARAGVGFDGVGDDADRAADRVRAAAREMAQGIRQGATKIDHETDGIRTNMADTGREAGAEFIGNVAEGIGSGTANVTEVMQGTLGGLTNLAATLGGPVGLAAAGAAAGIGLVFSAIRGEGERAKEALDTLRGALDDIKDKSGKAAEEAIFQGWLEKSQETAGKLENVNNVLKMAGVGAKTFMKALAGDPAAIERVTRSIATQEQKLDRMRDNGEGLNDAQIKYLRNAKMVTEEITRSDAAAGALRREQHAIDELSRATAENTKLIGDHLWTAEERARAVARELDDAAKDRRITFTVDVKRGQTMGELLGGLPRTTATGVSAMAAPAPVTVNVQAGILGPTSVRELVNLLESHQVRMGRRPGQVRAVAW